MRYLLLLPNIKKPPRLHVKVFCDSSGARTPDPPDSKRQDALPAATPEHKKTSTFACEGFL